MAAAAGSSRFAVTCGLLRQYTREQQQQQLGGLDGAFRLPPPPVATTEEAEETDGRTMQLFPTRAGTSQPSSQERPVVREKAPLTIVYDGRVLVFEDYPADKAEELMQLAGSGTSAAPQNKEAPAAVQQEKPAANPSAAAALPDLPIARKASLQRFLQKRKHRINTAEPYSKVTASLLPEKDVAGSGNPARDGPAASWLGL
ncbi:protein TIFY 10B-like [Panicum miliaceum]|uniref:Protein TIFY n=1 Tax=Panicum miliaceum TaxID=4540 RepID=A0A3L6SIL6_PANMI|nr:protein TIFY 10B-like [Panicum miliaceum]